jgi:hypothetical protein
MPRVQSVNQWDKKEDTSGMEIVDFLFYPESCDAAVLGSQDLMWIRLQAFFKVLF